MLDDNFIIDITDSVLTHEDWLKIVKFGKQTLLNNTSLFAEVITREAIRMAEKDSRNTISPSDFVGELFRELDITIVSTPSNLLLKNDTDQQK